MSIHIQPPPNAPLRGTTLATVEDKRTTHTWTIESASSALHVRCTRTGRVALIPYTTLIQLALDAGLSAQPSAPSAT